MSNLPAALLESVRDPRILVVGDLILDAYVQGHAERISPEGPIPVLRVTEEESRPGGAANVAASLAALGARAAVIGVTGCDASAEALADALRAVGVNAEGVVRDPARPTTVKTRYFGFVQSAHRGLHHMLRVDRESVAPLAPDVERRLLEAVERALPQQDAVVLSDYEKGALTEHALERIIHWARARGVPVITDPKRGRPYAIYRGSTVLTPNRYETQLATGIAPRDAASCAAAAQRLLDMADLEWVVLTLDRDGMYLAGRGTPGEMLAARPRDVVDVTGAGDMVVSVLALMLAAGAPLREAVALANIAAGIEVGKVGAAPVTRAEILAALSPAGADAKLVSEDQALRLAAETRRRGGKVVWTNGCFDLFHIGHYEYLRFARRQGDLLIVGLNSDSSVRRLKGPNRPITGEVERARLLAALDVVDAVLVFDDDTPRGLIEAIRPDVLVKGADYKVHEVVGHDLVESWGGRVALAPVVEGISTTQILKRVVERYGNDSPKG